MSEVLKTQQSFARKAKAQPEHRFGDLYHLVCRREWIAIALNHVLSNTGAKTAGVDGNSKAHLRTAEQKETFIASLQANLKAGTYQPQPVARVWIPKPGKTEKRGLGIPTISDRVVQELLRMLMEPIWESDFLDCSHGFRPGRRTMDCIYVFYSRVHTQNKYLWAIEGDLRKCFDRVQHGILLQLVRQRIADQRILSLIEAFLTAGIMEDKHFHDTPEGVPQGGVLSPLLSNIYLHQLDLWWWQKFGSLTQGEKWKRRQAGLGNAILTRYADDFVILWNGTHQGTLTLRDELKQFLWDELRVELSDEKTHVTHLTDGLDFLGFHMRWELPGEGRRPWLRVTPTKANISRFHAKLKVLTKGNTTFVTPEMKFKSLNRVIRGWGNYYRHVSFSHDASDLDYWLSQRVFIWLKHKHQPKRARWILQRYQKREIVKQYNRRNFGVADSQGTTVFIAKLQDIPLRAYRRKTPDNPYLTAKVVIPPEEPESPLVASDITNISPESVIWKETRAEVLRRDGYQCVRCGKRFVPFDIHHKTARQNGGTDDPENLETLCQTCHYQTLTYGRR
jgi:RNA-directed DNA polymerase